MGRREGRGHEREGGGAVGRVEEAHRHAVALAPRGELGEPQLLGRRGSGERTQQQRGSRPALLERGAYLGVLVARGAQQQRPTPRRERAHEVGMVEVESGASGTHATPASSREVARGSVERLGDHQQARGLGGLPARPSTRAARAPPPPARGAPGAGARPARSRGKRGRRSRRRLPGTRRRSGAGPTLACRRARCRGVGDHEAGLAFADLPGADAERRRLHRPSPYHAPRGPGAAALRRGRPRAPACPRRAARAGCACRPPASRPRRAPCP